MFFYFLGFVFALLKIRKLQDKRAKASRQILHLAAEAKLEAMASSDMVAAGFVTFEEEMGAVDARVSKTAHTLRVGDCGCGTRPRGGGSL